MVTFSEWIDLYRKILSNFTNPVELDDATYLLLENLNKLFFSYENIGQDNSECEARFDIASQILSIINQLIAHPLFVTDSDIIKKLNYMSHETIADKNTLYAAYQKTVFIKINDAINANNAPLARSLLFTDFARKHKTRIMQDLLADSFDKKRGKAGSQLAIDLLHELGADFNSFDNDDKTPLIRAVKSGQVDLVAALASVDANVNLGSQGYSIVRTPLYHAARELDVDCVNFLLSLHAETQSCCEVLGYIIKENNDTQPLALQMLEILIKAGMPVVNVKKDLNALKDAVSYGKLEFVKQLIRLGAPLYTDIVLDAIKSKNVELLAYLSNLNNPQIIFPNDIPYLKDGPVKSIVKSANLDVFQYCLSLNKSLKEYVIFDTVVLQTPSAVQKLVPTLDIPNLPLVNNPVSDSRLDYMHPGRGICSLAHVAAIFAVRESLAILIAAGLDIHAKDQHGLSPLHYAGLYGNLDAIKILIFAGAKLDTLDNNGLTPLHWIAQAIHKADSAERYIDCATALLFAGAKSNIKDKDNKTSEDYWNTTAVSKEKWSTAFTTLHAKEVKLKNEPETASLLQITSCFFANNKSMTQNLQYRKKLPDDLSNQLEIFASQHSLPTKP